MEKKGDIECPVCGSGSQVWERVASSKSGEDAEYNIYQCGFCHHGFIHPKVDLSLAASYDEEYAQNYLPEKDSELFRLRVEQYRKDAALLKRFVDAEDVKVLDFGCSTGQFLLAMPDSWKKHGFEINSFERAYVKKNYKDIRIFDELADIDSSFDVVTMRGVIEHMVDFEPLFSVLGKNLKKGGIVFISATPDFSSPCSILYRKRWNQISVPFHYHQFTQASIALLFAKAGFGLKAIYHPYLDTPYADFESDSIAFIENSKKQGSGQELKGTSHAYPGTMMSLVFQKMGGMK